MPDDRTIDTLSSRVVYSNRWLSLREDRIRHADGSEGIYSVVEKDPFALVVPWDGERLHLVGQWRHAVQRFCWEFPQGALDDGADTPLDEVARIELAEETGLRAGRIERLGALYTAYGHCNQRYEIFLAGDLSAGDASPEPGEHGIRSRAVTPGALVQMIRAGEFPDSHSVAAYQLFELRESVRS